MFDTDVYDYDRIRQSSFFETDSMCTHNPWKQSHDESYDRYITIETLLHNNNKTQQLLWRCCAAEIQSIQFEEVKHFSLKKDSRFFNLSFIRKISEGVVLDKNGRKKLSGFIK